MSVNGATVRRGSPLPKAVLGIALEGFWVAASLLQIQTSESFITGGPKVVSFTPNWSILTQPVQLFTGGLTQEAAKATLWGWGIELVFLVFVVGFEICHDAVKESNRRLAGWFQTGAYAIVLFEGWTDLNYGSLGTGLWGQIGFALVTSFMVLFFGIIGLRLLETAAAEWKR